MKKLVKGIMETAIILGLAYGVYNAGKAYVNKVKNNIEDSNTYYELNNNQESGLEKYIKIDYNDERIFGLEKVTAKRGETIEQLLLNNGIDVYEKGEENRSEWYNLFRVLNNLKENEPIIAGKPYLVPKLLDKNKAEEIKEIKDINWVKRYYNQNKN